MNIQKNEFAGNRKVSHSLFSAYEQKLVRLLTPIFSPFIQTYQLTLLTLLWCIGVLICSYLATTNSVWLWGVSLCIVFQYITDLFDGAVGRKNETGLIKWGYYMDHLLDYGFLCAIIIGYSFLLPLNSKPLALYWLALFSLFMVNAFLDFASSNIFRISYFKIGPTEIRLGFILLNAILFFFDTKLLQVVLPPFLFLSGCAVFLIILQTQRALWKADMLRRHHMGLGKGKTRLYRRYLRFSLQLTMFITALAFVYSLVFVSLTNPFNRVHIVSPAFTTSYSNGQIHLQEVYTPNVDTNIFATFFAYYKAAVHIFSNRYVGSKKAMGNTAEEIIAQIHSLRFNPDRPYLISGDQFSVLYPRNLGVFYHSLLDPRTALNETDWQNRERIYLQSVAYALETWKQTEKLSTTIVPIGIHTVTPINIYSYPSDALYGVLYALAVMENKPNEDQTKLYPSVKATHYTIETQDAAHALVESDKESLAQLVQSYTKTVYDNQTGLVKPISLSSARDAAKRQSSFYDNVIYWKTRVLASELGITPVSPTELTQLKQRIIARYWNTAEGHFRDDQSPTPSYSSDWLIVLPTGFLSVTNPTERQYIVRSISYIQSQHIDEPFPLSYQKRGTKTDEHPLVKIFVPSYGTDAIWSYWGTEYIKALLLLYQQTRIETYKMNAQKSYSQYTKNIVTYKGFPEIYDTKGIMLTSPFYASVRQTGWVVDYEQAGILLNQ